MKTDYLDKFQGCLIGVAIGDSLGHPFEGILREQIYSRFSDFKEFLAINKKRFNTYTDDTQLTLHTAKALIQGSGFNEDYFIREYVEWLEDPPIGPGYGCISSIQKLKYGISWKKAASNSGGNGTAMRVSPIGLFYNKDTNNLKNSALKSSIITHSHPAASAGAIVIARAIAFLINKTIETRFSVDKFFDAIISPISNSREEIWDEFIKILNKVKNSLKISLEAVACAIFIFLKNLNSFEECIFQLATAGGDSDTVGAIGGSLAGSYFGKGNIPRDLIQLVKGYKDILKTGEELWLKFKDIYITVST